MHRKYTDVINTLLSYCLITDNSHQSDDAVQQDCFSDGRHCYSKCRRLLQHTASSDLVCFVDMSPVL